MPHRPAFTPQQQSRHKRDMLRDIHQCRSNARLVDAVFAGSVLLRRAPSVNAAASAQQRAGRDPGAALFHGGASGAETRGPKK